MKKLLVLLLLLISVLGFGQTKLNPNASFNIANVNTAIQGSVTATGTDTYAATFTGLTNVAGNAYSVTFVNANSGSASFNLNSAGPVTIRKFESGSLVNLVAGDISAGETKRLRYNGTYLVIEGGSGGGGTVKNVTGTTPINVADGSNEPIISIDNAAADGSTKGAASFAANDFNASSGNISIDYTNGQAASGSNNGFLSSANWTTFNNKQSAITFGTGVQTALGVNIGSAGAPVLFNGAGGTPSSITLTNGTGLPISGITGLGTGVGTWLATPSWTNFNSAITGTAPFWSLSGTSTRTGNTAIIGTGYTLKHQYASLGAVKTIGYGMHLQNPSSAALGAQQWSPVLTLEGQAWLTTSSTSVDVGYSAYVIPIQGAGTAGGTFVLEPTVNGTTLGTGYLKMSANGALLDVTPNGIQIRSSAGGAGGLSFNGSTPASGQILMTSGSFSITTAGAWSSGGKGVVISAGSAINSVSGTQNAISLEGNFIPTSGTAAFRALNFPNTINQTGGANGQVNFVSITPTYTSAADVIAYDYAPVSGSPTSHLVWRNVSGNLLFGGSTITASTRVDQRGLGTTSSTINHRWGNSSNDVLASLTDDGTMSLTHLTGVGSAPTISAGTGAGTGPTVSVTGTDLGGYITITTGTLPAATTTVATITFSKTYTSAPRCVALSPAGVNSAGLSGLSMVYVDQSAITTTTFTITSGTSLAASTTYKWYYHVIQ